ncbi:YhjD/YihY/BrkB family envelope integrity protein [Candidatus Poriferisocius sp.]|uniref:YhjD/YihY/BrkB family envelope integrity protein n=1 Tax=Candidatus Poriferisocius sp. TaxID=3101276 RepID=UPI003B59F2CB
MAVGRWATAVGRGLSGSSRLVSQSVSCWRSGEGGTGAAEIAFWSAVSLFPAAVAAAAIASTIRAVSDRIADRFNEWLADAGQTALGDVDPTIGEEFAAVVSAPPAATSIAAAVALWGSMRAAATACRAVRRVRGAPRRSWWLERITGLGLLAGAVPLVAVPAVVAVWVDPRLGPMVGFLSAVAVFVLVQKMACPNRPRRHHVVGGLVSAVWFSAVSAVAAVAVNWTVGGTAVTVATAGTLAALSWLWAAACSITAGAAVAGALDRQLPPAASPPDDDQ